MNRTNDSREPSDRTEQHASADAPAQTPFEQAGVTQDAGPDSGGNKEKADELAREFRWVEWASVGANAVLVVVGIVALTVYHGQLSVMRGTLEEMKRSGAQSTRQVWAAVDNMNWLARSMDGSIKEAEESRMGSERASRRALDTSIAIARSEQRAWIIVPRQKFGPYRFDVGETIRYPMSLLNVGKTPARSVAATVRAEIVAAGSDPALYMGLEPRAPTTLENWFPTKKTLQRSCLRARGVRRSCSLQRRIVVF